jgi:hypothetical protein
LIGNSFGLNNDIDPLNLALGPETLRVFVYEPMPNTFQATGEDFPDQFGCVLYVVDLPASLGTPTRLPDRATSPADAPLPEE